MSAFQQHTTKKKSATCISENNLAPRAAGDRWARRTRYAEMRYVDAVNSMVRRRQSRARRQLWWASLADRIRDLGSQAYRPSRRRALSATCVICTRLTTHLTWLAHPAYDPATPAHNRSALCLPSCPALWLAPPDIYLPRPSSRRASSVLCVSLPRLISTLQRLSSDSLIHTPLQHTLPPLIHQHGPRRDLHRACRWQGQVLDPEHYGARV